jgi:hypothetical protein
MKMAVFKTARIFGRDRRYTGDTLQMAMPLISLCRLHDALAGRSGKAGCADRANGGFLKRLLASESRSMPIEDRK